MRVLGVEEVGGIVANDGGVTLAQKGEVVSGEFTEVRVALYINSLVEDIGNKGKVNTQTASQIQKFALFFWRKEALCNFSFVAGGEFAGTLLHVEMRRIGNAVYSRPGGQFPARRLPPLYLLQGQGKVNQRVFATAKGQCANIVIGMLENVLGCRLVDHSFSSSGKWGNSLQRYTIFLTQQ